MHYLKQASELTDADTTLLAKAEEARALAYAPYSRFVVGAAILTSGDHIVLGANQENASFPLCMCGERVAVYHYSMRYNSESISTIAISVSNLERNAGPAAPCGACLQVLSEYESRQNSPIRILLKGDTQAVIDIPSIRDALPIQFDGHFLRARDNQD